MGEGPGALNNLHDIQRDLTEDDLSISPVFQEICVRKAAVNRSPHRLVKAAVQKISVMGIRIDQDLAAKLLQLFKILRRKRLG